MYLTSNAAVYVVPDRSGATHKADAIYMTLAGANPSPQFVGTDELPGKTNYIKGNRPDDWLTDVPTFAGARMSSVYPGIDVDWHGRDGNQIQYDFLVAPNADAANIEWQIEGAKSFTIDTDGNLLINTGFGTIKQQKPFTFQEQNGLQAEVESRFELREGNKIGFSVGNYDRTKALVIDPSVTLNLLAFSTYLGGSSNDVGLDLATDPAGNVYVTGYTLSTLFPTTPGTFDTSQNANEDIFVTKLNAAGTQIIFSTFIGGTGTEEARGIVLDSSNNIFLSGETTSSTYPTTVGAYDTTFNGSADAFVTKLNASGSTLAFSTFLGGSVFDEAYDIARDNSNSVYVVGRTSGGTFPTTAGTIDTSFNGVNDVFVSKLDSTGAALMYSTFLGGDASDFGESIKVDSGGNAYVTGFTANGTTVDFPTTAGAFQTTYQGGTNDIFVSKINPTGTALSYSTFLGGTDSDSANDIDIDSAGNAYIVGNVLNGGGYPVTVAAYDTTHNGALDVVITELNPTGTSLIYSTYIGGNGSDIGTGIALDSTGCVYVTGYTINSGTDYPTTTGAYQLTHNGGHDVFMSRFSPNGSTLLYSTMIGGLGDDDGNAIAIDPAGNVYLTGLTNVTATTPYPTTVDSYQTYYGGGQDVFVSKFGDYAISGRAVDSTGTALPNVAMAMSGVRSGFAMTDTQGYFAFTDTIYTGAFTVSATSAAYNFTPSTFTIGNLYFNTELNFVGRPISSGPTVAYVPVGGDVISTAGNIGLPNTMLTLFDPANPSASRSVTTDGIGRYRFDNVQAGHTYVISAQKDGFNFEPNTYLMSFTGEDLNLDFAASPNSPRPVQDFDGDGKTDLAVFRPSEGNWYIMNSQTDRMQVVHFGVAGDIPVAEDFDGDRRADVAVYRPSDGNWYRLNSSDGSFYAVHFGAAGDIPVPADFDGDGRTDIAVYRPADGVWHRLNSSDGSYSVEQWGMLGDRPVPADYDSDGKADVGVYRNGAWYRRYSSNGQMSVVNFGIGEDRPIAADFDGDGRPDIAVYRPSNGVWYWVDNADGEFHWRQFGATTDVPVPADYNGDGLMEQAVYRGGTWYIGDPNGSMSVGQFGLNTDLPVRAIR